MPWLKDLFIDEAKAVLQGRGSGTTEVPPETIILVDGNGNEVPAVLTEQEVDLTATANDIRLGSIAVTDDGIIEGEKFIPTYNTQHGTKAVPNKGKFVLATEHYEYTKLQAIICSYNKNIASSVGANRVAIDGYVYPVQSTEYESVITSNHDNGTVDFGITNDSGKPCLLRYILTKEIY